MARSISLEAWHHGIALFDGKTPLTVAYHKGDPAKVWHYSVELFEGKVVCVTRLNGAVLRRETPT